MDDLPLDARFTTNRGRVANRGDLLAVLVPAIGGWTIDDLVEACEAAKVPAGPVNTLDRVFATDQAQAREMIVEMTSPVNPDQKFRMMGNPLKFSKTPVSFRSPPPTFGQDTDDVLGD